MKLHSHEDEGGHTATGGFGFTWRHRGGMELLLILWLGRFGHIHLGRKR
jgi:hypothetical protein